MTNHNIKNYKFNIDLQQNPDVIHRALHDKIKSSKGDTRITWVRKLLSFVAENDKVGSISKNSHFYINGNLNYFYNTCKINRILADGSIIGENVYTNIVDDEKKEIIITTSYPTLFNNIKVNDVVTFVGKLNKNTNPNSIYSHVLNAHHLTNHIFEAGQPFEMTGRFSELSFYNNVIVNILFQQGKNIQLSISVSGFGNDKLIKTFIKKHPNYKYLDVYIGGEFINDKLYINNIAPLDNYAPFCDDDVVFLSIPENEITHKQDDVVITKLNNLNTINNLYLDLNNKLLNNINYFNYNHSVDNTISNFNLTTNGHSYMKQIYQQSFTLVPYAKSKRFRNYEPIDIYLRPANSDFTAKEIEYYKSLVHNFKINEDFRFLNWSYISKMTLEPRFILIHQAITQLLNDIPLYTVAALTTLKEWEIIAWIFEYEKLIINKVFLTAKIRAGQIKSEGISSFNLENYKASGANLPQTNNEKAIHREPSEFNTKILAYGAEYKFNDEEDLNVINQITQNSFLQDHGTFENFITQSHINNNIEVKFEIYSADPTNRMPHNVIDYLYKLITNDDFVVNDDLLNQLNNLFNYKSTIKEITTVCNNLKEIGIKELKPIHYNINEMRNNVINGALINQTPLYILSIFKDFKKTAVNYIYKQICNNINISENELYQMIIKYLNYKPARKLFNTCFAVCKSCYFTELYESKQKEFIFPDKLIEFDKKTNYEVIKFLYFEILNNKSLSCVALPFVLKDKFDFDCDYSKAYRIVSKLSKFIDELTNSINVEPARVYKHKDDFKKSILPKLIKFISEAGERLIDVNVIKQFLFDNFNLNYKIPTIYRLLKVHNISLKN